APKQKREIRSNHIASPAAGSGVRAGRQRHYTRAGGPAARAGQPALLLRQPSKAHEPEARAKDTHEPEAPAKGQRWRPSLALQARVRAKVGPSLALQARVPLSCRRNRPGNTRRGQGTALARAARASSGSNHFFAFSQ